MPTRWESYSYRHVYEDLVRQMNPSSIRDKCFVRVLITSEQRDDLSLLNGAKHNRSLLALLEKLNDDQYEVFCQVLLDNAVHVHDHSVAEMRKASDGAVASVSTHSQAVSCSDASQLEEAKAHNCTPTESVVAGDGILPNQDVHVEFTPESQYWLMEEALASTDIPLRTFAGKSVGGESFDMDRTRPIKIVIVNFDPELNHPQHAEVWTPLKEVVEAALGVKERQAREDLWQHFDHTARVDSIKEAVKRVKRVAEEFSGDIIGIVSSRNCNRLSFFHGEQSNSFKPVTDTFRKLPGGKVVAIVTQDYVKEGAEMMWRSADVTLGMEMQVQSSAMIGDRGLVLSWYKRPYTVHGRALAAFVLGMSRRPEDHAFPLPPLLAAVSTCPDMGADPVLSTANRRLSPHSTGEEEDTQWRYIAFIWPFIYIFNLIMRFRVAELIYTPAQTRFHLIYRTDTFNREVKPQVDQFVNSCLTSAGEVPYAEWPIQKSHIPSRESLQHWVFDSEGFRNVAFLFTAADAYYKNPSQLDDDISALLKLGFKHCIICAMFDAGFLDHPEDMDRIRSARLERQVPVPGGPASLVSWYSRPANAITRELLRTGVVPSREN